MYATINLPGSSHFDWYGPATKKECQEWLDKTVNKMLETELLTSTLPRRIISNKEANSWKYASGAKVFNEGLNL